MLRRTSKFWNAAWNPGGGMQGKMPRVPDGNPIAGTTGVPFYGNLYQGRVNANDYNPPEMGYMKSSGNEDKVKNRPVYHDQDPLIRSKLDRCPYFSLCDMCVWQGMDPAYLDPGVLTDQEHHLLLLHSRAYFEKWRKIHEKPREYTPNMRIKKGDFELTRRLLDMMSVPEKQQERLDALLLDDASLIAMQPKLWSTAYLHPTVRDHLSGRILDIAGVAEWQQERIFETLTAMRRIRVVRKDRNVDEEAKQEYRNNMWTDKFDSVDDEVVILPYSACRTLFDFCTRLGIEPYSGQVKLYNYYDEKGTRLTMTVNSEEQYFDYLYWNFFNSNLGLYGEECMSRYTLVIENWESCRRDVGRWF